MAEPEDMIVPLVREVRWELGALRSDMAEFRKDMNDRLIKLIAGVEDLRATFEGRIQRLEAHK